MRDVVVRFEDNYPHNVLAFLEERIRKNGSDLNIKMLEDIVPKELVSMVFSQHLARSIGIEHIGDPHAVVWAAGPFEDDWFKRLHEEGYRGKRVLVHTAIPSAYNLKDYATHVLAVPKRGFVDELYGILNS